MNHTRTLTHTLAVALPIALAGLLGSAALVPMPAAAYPRYAHDRYDRYERYGSPSSAYAPLPVDPHGYPDYRIAAEPLPYEPALPRRCNVGTVLGGAAIGGGLGAVLANNSRNRRWSLPMGAAVGGILGGLISGC